MNGQQDFESGFEMLGRHQEGLFDRFFAREKRETKVEDFINLRQVGMRVMEYSLKFTKLSKYGPSLVFGPRD